MVFDTETTGLRPSEGDEIISIAAVRCRLGEIDETDAFSRLVDPGRPIPRASIRFHGITDDMVAGEPPIGDVLPAFQAYVGDAVLVAHNADFDMTFLRLKEAETDIEFANVVLDTLLISVFLDPVSRNHSLEAIAERLGVEVEGRHTALGDSIVTARVFCKLLPRLEARGITTLGQVLDASAQIRRARGARPQILNDRSEHVAAELDAHAPPQALDGAQRLAQIPFPARGERLRVDEIGDRRARP